MGALGPDDLVLCAGTLPRAGFAERVRAAARAGFRGISLFADHVRAAREVEGLGDADMRALLDDCGIAVAELDPLMRWLPGAELGASATEEGAGFFAWGERDFYAIADALGARSLNAALVTDRAPAPAEVAEAFAGLCDRAREHGLLVHLEFLPWTSIPNLAGALEIAAIADRPNGGVTLDAWHHFRSGGDVEAVRSAPGGRILSLQLDDAPAEPEGDPVEETLRRRRLPGEGALDLVGLVRALDASGCRAPVGVEVFSDALAALPPDELARRAADATRAVLARARA